MIYLEYDLKSFKTSLKVNKFKKKKKNPCDHALRLLNHRATHVNQSESLIYMTSMLINCRWFVL